MELGQIMPEDTKPGGYYQLQFKDNGKRTSYIWLYKQNKKGIRYGDGVFIPDNAVPGYNNLDVSFADYIDKPDRCIITAMTSEQIRYFEYCIHIKYITIQEFEKFKPKELPIFN